MPKKSIDHFIILAEEQDAAREAYIRLGFTMTPVVTHPELGSTNSVAIFPETYLEVLHLGTSGPEMRTAMAPRFAAGEGLCLICLNSDSLEAEEQRLKEAGLHPGPTVHSWRPVPMPDGTEGKTDSASMFNWKDVRPYLSFFFSEHHKPEMIFVEGYMTHENGALDLLGITAVSDDPEGDLDYYQRCYADAAVESDDTGFTMRGRRGDFMSVLTMSAARASYPCLLDDLDLADTGGFPVALHYGVRNMSQTAAYLRKAGVDFVETEERIVVRRSDGVGCLLVFEPAS